MCYRARFFTHQSAREIPKTNPETTRKNPELLPSDFAKQLVAIDNYNSRFVSDNVRCAFPVDYQPN